MDSALELIRRRVADDPDPALHASSHWLRYGPQLGGKLEAIYRPHPVTRLFKLLERISYRQVTRRYRSYPEVWGAAKRLAGDLAGGLTSSVFKSAAALALLSDHWRAERLSPRRFLLIGDGAGFLGALLRRRIPEARIYSVDLPRMLLLQAETHRKADPALTCSASPALREDPVTFVFPEDLEKIPGRIDCAVAIASMQEMTSRPIGSYFGFLRARSGPDSRFYCVSRERKTLPGGEVVEFDSYPWNGKDEIFLDGECPYYTHYFGLPPASRGPRFLGVRVPLVNYFDGRMRHRLVRLAPAAGAGTGGAG